MKDNDQRDLKDNYQGERSITQKAKRKREYMEAVADEYDKEINNERKQQLLKRLLEVPEDVITVPKAKLLKKMELSPKPKESTTPAEKRIDNFIDHFRSVMIDKEISGHLQGPAEYGRRKESHRKSKYHWPYAESEPSITTK